MMMKMTLCHPLETLQRRVQREVSLVEALTGQQQNLLAEDLLERKPLVEVLRVRLLLVGLILVQIQAK
jgi:hypothetical protein